MEAWFVDIHSHVVPSGDDGVDSVSEGGEICREAQRHGTRLLYATPHVWPHLPLTDERERAIRAAFPRVRERAGLELRLGFELTPHPRLLREDPERYVLEGTDAVLVEVPFAGPAADLWRVAEHIEAAGLRPVIAHPERTEAVELDPELPAKLVARGWLLQVNATSVTGRHGPESEETAWRLLADGLVALVGSDGHRATRPPHLDKAYELVRARLGDDADRLFDGSALELVRSLRPTASRAAMRGA